MSISPEIIDRLEKLEKKYEAAGQNLLSYLDGLLYTDYLTYWDYIHLDVLMNLQTPRTNFPDEETFIIYHQITELYFKLITRSQDQILEQKQLDVSFFIKHMQRINRYFENLTHSFAVMVEGMDPEQFLKFRMALLPASGFQSAQYRMIEIRSTSIANLVAADKRKDYSPDSPISELFENIYWKQGATELASGNKTLTLKQFEKKYSGQFLELMDSHKNNNIWTRFQSVPMEDPGYGELRSELRSFDLNANVRWPLAHYKSAVRYLQKDPEDIAATGGTNWQKYMPPKNQRIIFFPQLWEEGELEEWGKIYLESKQPV